MNKKKQENSMQDSSACKGYSSRIKLGYIAKQAP